ncbi:glycosyltransferase family 2 protein [Fimbriimonas ginsengisoli]|uniref:Glycosyl transferase, family 2 n=1 Tax=Fimbriimonas ginsengisoli Gsoil 348 TaxID=661478 RepID=A0A068NV77_FIMGI|nr:glycosyltransferase family 2 protein [Fimbriimonas ginsengisoli]AIE86665.1 glycosyl transferase, family 2 [Fimbriimonas ginsengisoli Gsoil 348]
MDPQPLVSIVTVSFNQAQYLRACIESVLGQTYPNVEYIVIDGGSADNSAEIIAEYADRLKYWHSKKDNGPADALNQGFEQATGTIFAYLNSDDVLLPEAVQKWVDAFQKNPRVDLVYGGIKYLDGEGRPTKGPGGGKAWGYPACPWSIRTYAAGVMVLPQQASAWKRTLHEAVGGFNADNRTNWDPEFYAQAAVKGFAFKDIPAVLAGFRFHEKSITVGLLSNPDEKTLARRATARARTREIFASNGIQISDLERKWRKATFRLMHAACLVRDYRQNGGRT